MQCATALTLHALLLPCARMGAVQSPASCTGEYLGRTASSAFTQCGRWVISAASHMPWVLA